MPFAQNTQVTIIIQNNINIYAYINSIFLYISFLKFNLYKKI